MMWLSFAVLSLFSLHSVEGKFAFTNGAGNWEPLIYKHKVSELEDWHSFTTQSTGSNFIQMTSNTQGSISITSRGPPSFLLKSITSNQAIYSSLDPKTTHSSEVFRKADVLLFVAAFPKSPNSYVSLDTLRQCTAGDRVTDLNLVFECVKGGRQDVMVIAATMEFPGGSRARLPLGLERRWPVELPRKISVSASSSHSAKTGGYTVTDAFYVNSENGPSAESLSTDITRLESTDESGAHSASLSAAQHTITIASKGDAKVFVRGRKLKGRPLFQGWNAEVSSLSHGFQGERLIFVLYTPEAKGDHLRTDHLSSCIHPEFLSPNGVLNEDLCKNDELVLLRTLDCLKKSEDKGFFMVGFLDYKRSKRSIPKQNFGPFLEAMFGQTPTGSEMSLISNVRALLDDSKGPPGDVLEALSKVSEPKSKALPPSLSPRHEVGFILNNTSNLEATEDTVEIPSSSSPRHSIDFLLDGARDSEATEETVETVETEETVETVETEETVETLLPSSSSKNSIDFLLNGAQDSEGTEESPPPLSPRHHVSFILDTPPANPLRVRISKHALGYILDDTASS